MSKNKKQEAIVNMITANRPNSVEYNHPQLVDYQKERKNSVKDKPLFDYKKDGYEYTITNGFKVASAIFGIDNSVEELVGHLNWYADRNEDMIEDYGWEKFYKRLSISLKGDPTRYDYKSFMEGCAECLLEINESDNSAISLACMD